jgi:hypothetical protein
MKGGMQGWESKPVLFSKQAFYPKAPAQSTTHEEFLKIILAVIGYFCVGFNTDFTNARTDPRKS